jgi:hypothetical protein
VRDSSAPLHSWSLGAKFASPDCVVLAQICSACARAHHKLHHKVITVYRNKSDDAFKLCNAVPQTLRILQPAVHGGVQSATKKLIRARAMTLRSVNRSAAPAARTCRCTSIDSTVCGLHALSSFSALRVAPFQTLGRSLPSKQRPSDTSCRSLAGLRQTHSSSELAQILLNSALGASRRRSARVLRASGIQRHVSDAQHAMLLRSCPHKAQQ